MKCCNIFIVVLFSCSVLQAIEPEQNQNSRRRADIEMTKIFPSLRLKEIHLYVPDSIGDLTCESCVHTPGCPFNYHIISAMYPENSSDWMITNYSDRKNRKLKSHPLYPVAKIYKAFRKGRKRKMIRQYNKESRPTMKEVFLEDNTKQEIKEVFGPVDYLSVPIILKYNSGYFIITVNKEHNLLYPFYAEKKKKNRMLLSTAIDSTGLFGDMLVLGLNYRISDLILNDDYDNDGVLNLNDNCPCNHNPEQEDSDADHVGNSCDNCKDVANTNQEDYDGDGIGDVCDNCPRQSNVDQTDTDGDGIGDQCEEYTTVKSTMK